MIGLVPVAGAGTRMMPLTEKMPKALIKIDNKALIDYALDSLLQLDLERIVIVHGEGGELIKTHLEDHQSRNKFQFAIQETPHGLINAIQSTLPAILGNDILLYCPDNIFDDNEDISRAVHCFNEQSAEMLTLVTAAPTEQGGRMVFEKGTCLALAPYIYRCQAPSADNANIATLASTGVSILSRHILPQLACQERSSSLAEFGDTLDNHMLYLSRGMRHDFTTPTDVESYGVLMNEFLKTRTGGVSIILRDNQGCFLMQLRDNNPAIRYPNHWALFGGTIEENETEYDAIIREIKEELGFDLKEFSLIKKYVYNNKREYVFFGKCDRSSVVHLTEGQAFGFFSEDQLTELLIRPDDKMSLEYFLKRVL